jgi:hypothetical protein
VYEKPSPAFDRLSGGLRVGHGHRGNPQPVSATRSGEEFEVEGRRLRITSLDRVMFPQTRTTKADLLAYYAKIALFSFPICGTGCCICTATRKA